MRQGRASGKARETTRPKTTWRLIEGDSRRIHKVIQEILDGTGDNVFEVEFRIHRSSRRGTVSPEAEKPASPPRVTRRETTRRRARPGGRRRASSLSWSPVLLATVPIALTVYYLTRVAPALVPVPASTKVPFPAVTRLLEQVCVWCGEFPLVVVLMGVALLLPGLLVRSLRRPRRYYLPLAVVVSLALGLAYLSISAPLGGLASTVEAVEPGAARSPAPGAGPEMPPRTQTGRDGGGQGATTTRSGPEDVVEREGDG